MRIVLPTHNVHLKFLGNETSLPRAVHLKLISNEASRQNDSEVEVHDLLVGGKGEASRYRARRVEVSDLLVGHDIMKITTQKSSTLGALLHLQEGTS